MLQAIRPELQQELRTALFQALQLHDRVDAPPVRVSSGGQDVFVKMSVRPMRHDAWPGEMLLVVFEETPVVNPAASTAPARDDPVIAELESELLRRNQQLAATIEQYETSSEELKASNEELQAINEELRSATEELETSKEELQSTNEELITVNHELKTKIDETTEINDDLNNLISSSDTATVFVDAAMRIKRFTPAAAALFNLIAGDIGRSLFDITHRLEYDGLAQDARAVFATLKTIEREIRSTDGRHLLARLLPYRTAEDRIGGAVLNFVDVTSLRRAEDTVTSSEERLALVAESMTDFAILTIDMQGRIATWTPGARHVFGYEAEEAIGQPFDILFTDEDRARGAPASELREADQNGRAPDERWMRRKDGSAFFASGVTAPLRSASRGYAKICRDTHGDGHRPGAGCAPADGGRGRHRRGDPGERAEERVPGGDVARAEASAQPDQRQRRAADGPARGAGPAGGAARGDDDPAHGPEPGPDHRRPARHVAHQHRQAGGQPRAAAARRGDPAVHGLGPGRGAKQGRAAVRRRASPTRS